VVYIWAVIGTVSAVFAIFSGYMTVRVWRANPAVYEINRAATGNFINAAIGRVASIATGKTTDFHVNNYVEPCETEDGQIVWERASSLSDEAVDSVLARH
jgi:hypothetical protein